MGNQDNMAGNEKVCMEVQNPDDNKYLWYAILGAFGRVFTSGFSGRLASDNRKFRENSSFFNSLKLRRVGKFQ